MSVGVALMWPMIALLGFVAMTGVVVALGASSTGRYEFERNGAREQQQSAARGAGAHPAANRSASRRADAPTTQSRPQGVGVAVRPAAAPAIDRVSGTGWWLVEDSADEPRARVVAGPFADRMDADWAALATGVPAVAVYGAVRADGALAPRTSPEERTWLAELGQQLDRLGEDWEPLVSDADALTTLVVEVAAALVEAGLPLHDCAQQSPLGGGPAGGVCLTPELGRGGVLVSWHAHDRMSVQQLRGADAEASVQQLMNTAIADVLARLGFGVEPLVSSGCHVVTAVRH